MTPRAAWRVGLVTVALLILGVAGYWLTHPAQPAAHGQLAPLAPGSQPALEAASTLSDASAAIDDSAMADCPTRPLAFVSSPASRRPLVVRRYVGTIGGQPATAVLQWQNPDSVEGRFYLHQGGPEYTLSMNRKRSGPLVLPVYQEYVEGKNRGEWHLTNQLGIRLNGTWREAGRQQVIALRESYAGAIPYSLETQHLVGGKAETEGPDATDQICIIPTLQRNFLTLSQPASVLPELWPVLSLTPTARRQLMLDTREADAEVNVWLNVRLNDFGLFSYQTIYTARPFGSRLQYDIKSALFDLATGQPLTIASQLQPGYELELRRLLSAHFLHDPNFSEINNADTTDENREATGVWAWRNEQNNPGLLVPLPDLEESSTDDLALTGEGLEVTYSPFSLFESPGGMLPYTQVVVSYAELRPLVRPNTPLARMLAARRMW